MKIIIIIFLLLSFKNAIDPSFYESGNQRPPPIVQFGLYLLLHDHPQPSSIIHHYSQMVCHDIIQILVLDQSQEKLSSSDSKVQFESEIFSIKKPKSQLFLVLDGSKNLTCTQMTNLFEKWKQLGGNHYEVVGVESEANVYDFMAEEDEFCVFSASSSQQQYYSFFNFNMLFVPHHLMKMFKVQEFLLTKNPDCWSVLFGMIHDDLYPQSKMKIIFSTESLEESHYKQKETKCLNMLYPLFHQNPLKLLLKEDKFKTSRFELPFHEQYIQLKESFYEAKHYQKYVNGQIKVQKIQQTNYQLKEKDFPFSTRNKQIQQEMEQFHAEIAYQNRIVDEVGLTLIVIGLLVLMWLWRQRRYKYYNKISDISVGDNP